MQYKTIDLCAGIGGIRRGFELAGDFKTVASAEIDEQACQTYEHLYGDDPRNDITSDKFKQRLKSLRYDVLMAGFPCQAFSSVGLRQGFKDKIKGTIFFDIAEIIEHTTPKVVFLENVENLVSHNKGNTFKTIIETLEKDLGYKVIGVTTKQDGSLQYNARSFVRNSKDFGIPQNRPRVYIVAFSRVRVNKFAVTQGQGLLRLNTASVSLSYSLSGDGKINGNDGTQQAGGNPADHYTRIYYHPVTGEYIPGGYLYYMNPNVPWSVNFNYSFSYRPQYQFANEQMTKVKNFTQTLGMSGNIKLTPRLSMQMNTNFDIMALKMSATQISATYDLHCFKINVSWVPNGKWEMWSFRIQANAAALADLLKFKKSSSYWDNGF